MFTSTTSRAPRLIPGTRLRRITAALAAAASGVLAWAAAISAASAAIIPVPAQGGGYGPAGGTSATIPVPAIAAGGMPGWQITLIAVAAALTAAAAAVFLDRVRANRRTASTTG
jgi:hypothetical protein